MIKNQLVKKDLRAHIRARRQALSPEFRAFAQETIAKRAARLVRPKQKIAVYCAAGSELVLDAFLQRAWRKRCQIYFPIVPKTGKKLCWAACSAQEFFGKHVHKKRARFSKKNFKINRLKIFEPTSRSRKIHDFSHVFLPLVGFDAQKHRLGQGGGFYDATFARRRWSGYLRPKLIGMAFSVQQVEAIQTDKWDLTLDMILTERASFK